MSTYAIGGPPESAADWNDEERGEEDRAQAREDRLADHTPANAARRKEQTDG